MKTKYLIQLLHPAIRIPLSEIQELRNNPT